MIKKTNYAHILHQNLLTLLYIKFSRSTTAFWQFKNLAFALVCEHTFRKPLTVKCVSVYKVLDADSVYFT